MPQPFLRRLGEHWPLALVLLAWLPIRILLAICYWPWVCGDTPGYSWIIVFAATKNLDHFAGERTPGYALLMFLNWLATGASDTPSTMTWQCLVLIQMAMGLAVAILLYTLVWKVTGSRMLAAGTALLQVICLNFAQFEVMLLSEIFASFLITLILFTFVWLSVHPPRTAWPWVLLGILIASAALTRPNNLFFLPLCLAGILSGFPDMTSWGARFRRAAVVLGVAAPPILAWCMLLYVHLGTFGMTSVMGFHLTHKTIDFVDLAPPEYEPLKKILLPYERNVIEFQKGGKSLRLDSRIWYAIREIRHLPQYKDLSFTECMVSMSRDLLKMDRELILAHPDLYAGAVGEACVRFWKPANFTSVPLSESYDPRSPDAQCVVRSPALQDRMAQLASWTSIPLYVACLMLPLIAGFAIAIRIWTPRIAIHSLVWFGLATLFLGMLTCALVEYGNGRFIIPYQPIVLATVAVGSWNLIGAFKCLKRNE